MRLLVATSASQGHRSNDFHNATEGEPLTFSMECDGERIDGRCGCRRAMVGMLSHKASTTFVARQHPGVDMHVLRSMVRASLMDSGWITTEPERDAAADEEWVTDLAEDIARVGAAFPEGAVVERRGEKFQSRPGYLAPNVPVR